jgi:hypothetical protein
MSDQPQETSLIGKENYDFIAENLKRKDEQMSRFRDEPGKGINLT